MDTDDLTPMAYDCIRYADDVSDILKAELGAACTSFRTEDEYLSGILKHVREIEKDPEGYLDRWNLLDLVDMKVFKRKVRVLREYIQKTINTSLKDRGKPKW
jgi:hypothetical protein